MASGAALRAKPAKAQAEVAVSPEAVVATLEEDIVFGRLHPRERLVEDELIERFGLKRHAVRDVLATLERMGLVERHRNVGALVHSFTPTEVTELYDMRLLLETEAARKLPLPVPRAALKALTEIQDKHDDAVAAGDAAAVFRTNIAFHQALFGLLGHGALQQAIDEYARQTHPIRFGTLASPQYREQSRREHRAMIAALRSQDRASLVKLCGQHLLPSRDAYLAAHQMRFGHGVKP
jgi:DNA-binding GntR family transcriptional regulator